jgi:hypothetical protein
VPFFTVRTRFRKPSVAVSISPLAPLALLRALLLGADQCPAHTVVMYQIVQHLLIRDTDDLDDLPRLDRVTLLVALEHLDALMSRRPLGQRLEVEQHRHDFVGRCLDDDLARFGDSHAANVASAGRASNSGLETWQRLSGRTSGPTTTFGGNRSPATRI